MLQPLAWELKELSSETSRAVGGGRACGEAFLTLVYAHVAQVDHGREQLTHVLHLVSLQPDSARRG